MPRETIERKENLEYLSILDEEGSLDEDLEPKMDKEQLLRMHRCMVLSRHFDKRMISLQRSGELGTFAPAIGQEGAQIGTAAVLKDTDWFVPAFRETPAYLWRGGKMKNLLLYNAGYNEGAAIPDDAHDFPIAIPVATQIPHAVGLAYAAKYRGSEEAVLTYFGDGATSEGDFHEAMNFAGVFETPTVFVCQNNQWAISIPREKQTDSSSLAQKALAYGMPGIQVDGNDILACYVAAREALERARNGDGPTLIECVTYRLAMHTTVDDPSQYRDEEKVNQWWEKEPIKRFQTYLENKDLLDEDDIERVENEVEEEISNAWDETKEKIKELNDPLVMFDHVHENMPTYLKWQRDQLEAQLQKQGGRDNG